WIASVSKAPTAATSPAAEVGALDQHLEAAAASYVLDTCDRRRVNRTGFVGENSHGTRISSWASVPPGPLPGHMEWPVASGVSPRGYRTIRVRRGCASASKPPWPRQQGPGLAWR